ncbi:MAG TPA: nickel pincer cofactor biosynthesis protein LarB [Clostridiaceae bacterium]|nr:nickel pincer cofactor biosynthesis protein LarB [Clostridiaceae bacterium]
MNQDIIDILNAVKNQEISVEEALLKIKKEPFADIGYAKVDLHRGTRQGAAEVIFGAGKTAEQICGIIATMLDHDQNSILITRLKPEYAEVVSKNYSLKYYSEAQLGIAGDLKQSTGKFSGIGNIIVATGGTSDIPVAEEAALTAEFYGNKVIRLYDVGVAGLHRLLSHLDEIMSASVIIAVAGMEGALASVIGGLVDCPVIAVPTSVGYGASFSGLTALLSMLNSCSSGVSVVNIDNGFGAGYLANMINHMGKQSL